MPLDPDLTEFTTASPIVVNVDFSDFTYGLGYVEFFCFESEDNTSKKYNILNKALRGSATHKLQNGITLEFTTTFGITQIMGGKAYAQFHWGFTNNGNESSSYATISIEKNGVELVTARGTNLTFTSSIHRVEVISFDIPETSFSQNDVFKIKIVIPDTATSSPNSMWLGFDPLDTSFTPGGAWGGGAVTETQFKLNTPFKIG